MIANAQSTSDSASINTGNSTSIDVDSAEIHLGSEPYEGDLTLTRENGLLVLDPGEHEITGNVTINAPGETVLVSFDRDKIPGSLKAGGILILGPENAPRLALDLSLVDSFSVGEVFTIMSANNIEGYFNGLGEGDTFEVGDLKLRISYQDGKIMISVVSAPKRWDRDNLFRTPTTELDNSLIKPTSTNPG